MSETLFELERAYDRADLAALFREVAAALEGGHTLELHTAEQQLSVDVPPRVVVELEAERDVDEEVPVAGLEFELEWDDADGSSVRVEAADVEGETRGEATADEADAEAEPTAVDVDGAAATGETGDESTAAPEEEPTEDPASAAMPPDAVPGGDREGDGKTAADRAPRRTSRFEVYEDRAGQWRWRLVHWNGNIVADSGEGYASRSNAERAARSVMRSAPTASVVRREG